MLSVGRVRRRHESPTAGVTYGCKLPCGLGRFYGRTKSDLNY